MSPEASRKMQQKSAGTLQIVNANMYAKLIDNSYDTTTLVSQYRSASSKDLLQGIEFVSKRCSTFRDSLQLVQKVWEQSNAQTALQFIVDRIALDLKIKYVSIYEFDVVNGNYAQKACNWKAEKSVLEESCIIHGAALASTKEKQSSFAFRKSDEYSEDIERQYPRDIDCILSIPIMSKKVTGLFGILEVINRSTPSQFISDEEELVLHAYASVIGFFLEYMSGQSQISRKSDAVEKLTQAIDSLSKYDLDFQETSASLLLTAQSLIGCDRCNFYLLDTAKLELIANYSSVPIKFPIPSNSGSFVNVCVAKNIIVTESNVPANSQYYDRRAEYKTLSILAVPVLGETGKPIGAVEFLNKRGKSAKFLPSDQAIATVFARACKYNIPAAHLQTISHALDCHPSAHPENQGRNEKET